MSKLIVEMDMPKNCKKCPLVGMDHFGQIRCKGQGGRLIHLKNFQTEIDRPSWCPIKGVLPDEHGDLIDRDVVYKQIQLWKSTATDTITMGFLYHFEKLLMCTRPIIAAERKDDEQIH